MTRVKFSRLAVFGVLLGAGCATSPPLTRSSNELERSIRYREISRSGTEYNLSSSSSGAVGVPNGAEVDINSTIEIEIRKDEVHVPRGLAAPSETDTLASKAGKIKDALTKLSALIDARSSALAAYERIADIPLVDRPSSSKFKEFITARDATDKLENQFTNLPLWTPQEISIAEPEIEKAFEDPTYKAVGGVLQNELDKVESAFRDAEDRAKRKALSLRLEAFLEPSKGDHAAIHLPNYDSLDQREARFKESNFLDKDDWESFQKQYIQTVDLAKEAEKVRKGESSLRDSIKKVGLSRLDKLMGTLDELDPFLRQDWPALSQKVSRELTAAANTTQAIISKYTAQGLSELSQTAEQAKQTLASAPQISDIKNLAGRLKELRDEWRKVSPESLVGTMAKTKEFVDAAPRAVAKADELIKIAGILTPLIKSLESKPTELSQAAWDDLKKELIQGGSLEQTKKLVAAADAIRRLGDEIKSTADFLSAKPSMTNLRVPEARDISWAEAPNTRIELPRTPRSIDDRVHLLATLKVGESDYMKSHAVFSVQKFSWHSSLAPSVILAKPMRTTSSFDRDFKFAPAVAWLKTYYPRDTDPGFWNSAARISQVGFGLHAAFLDFDSQKDAEIGLGGALSFWHDRIVAGVGWNLMNNSRAYFYVGSNLIPVLQALGYGKEGGAGKQP